MGPAFSDNRLVACLPDGSFMHPARVSRDFRRMLDKLGLSPRFHDTRHSSASYLIGNGVHMKAISERLGDSSIKLTMDTYGHLIRGLDKAAAEGLDATMRTAIEQKS